jgi:hypothetical protein
MKNYGNSNFHGLSGQKIEIMESSFGVDCNFSFCPHNSGHPHTLGLCERDHTESGNCSIVKSHCYDLVIILIILTVEDALPVGAFLQRFQQIGLGWVLYDHLHRPPGITLFEIPLVIIFFGRPSTIFLFGASHAPVSCIFWLVFGFEQLY